MDIIDRVGSPAVKVYYDLGNSHKHGYDIYQDQRTLGGDGRFIGVVMAKTDNMESSIWFYRSDPSSVTPSIDDRIKGLADRLKGVVAVLGTEMS